MSGGSIYYLIYPWQWETILGTCIIEIGIVYTHSPLSSLLGNHHYICQSLWILNFSYESDFQQFFHFILNNLLHVRVESSDFLSNGL